MRLPLLLFVAAVAVCVLVLCDEGDERQQVRVLGRTLRLYQREVALLKEDLQEVRRLVGARQRGREETEGQRAVLQGHWMVIGVPTVPRKSGEYLTRTLESIAFHLPKDSDHPLYGKVLVVVFNSAPGKHVVFERLKAAYADNPHFVFEANAGRVESEDPGPVDPGSPNVPGSAIRHQTADLVSLMEHVHRRHSGKYFFILEDDMNFCPGTLQALLYVTEKVERAVGSGFSTIRTSFGMNGAILQWTDVPVLAKYMSDNIRRRPPDHLSVEWYAQETPRGRQELGGRKLFSFRYNLFFHTGTESSLRSAAQSGFPGCFHELAAPILFEVEAFDKRACPREDLSPCDTLHPRGTRIKFQSLDGPPPVQ